MMEWRLANLQGEYKQKTGKNLSYRMIAEGTGLSKTTVMGVANGNVQRPDLGTLNALITFMSNALGRPLTTDDLLRYIPDN